MDNFQTSLSSLFHLLLLLESLELNPWESFDFTETWNGKKKKAKQYIWINKQTNK